MHYAGESTCSGQREQSATPPHQPLPVLPLSALKTTHTRATFTHAHTTYTLPLSPTAHGCARSNCCTVKEVRPRLMIWAYHTSTSGGILTHILTHQVLGGSRKDIHDSDPPTNECVTQATRLDISFCESVPLTTWFTQSYLWQKDQCVLCTIVGSA